MYFETRIITSNSKDGRLFNGTYKSSREFQIKGMIKQEENMLKKYKYLERRFINNKNKKGSATSARY